MDRVARRGPLARAPGALKGDTSEIVNNFVAVEGGPFGEKTHFRKSLTMPKNWKGDPLGFLNTQSVVKYQRNWRGTLWREKNRKKSLTMPKNWKGDPLGFFNIHSVTKHQKIEVGKNFVFGRKISQCRKNWRGTLSDFPTSILTQNGKKMKGGHFGGKIFQKNVSQCRKKLKGGPFGVARYGMLRGTTGKTFLVQFARPNGAIWHHNIL